MESKLDTFFKVFLIGFYTVFAIICIIIAIILYGFYRDVKDYPCIESHIENGVLICDERLDLTRD